MGWATGGKMPSHLVVNTTSTFGALVRESTPLVSPVLASPAEIAAGKPLYRASVSFYVSARRLGRVPSSLV